MHGTAREMLLMRADIAIREARALRAQANHHIGLGAALCRQARMASTFHAGLPPAQAIALLVLQTQAGDMATAAVSPATGHEQAPSQPTEP